MSLPVLWVEKIFTKLTLAYGRDFLGRWEGIPLSEVKTDWSECLKGFADQPQSIAFALTNLPDSKPPTAQEFRALCRQAPQTPTSLLTASKADYTVVAEQLAKIGKTVGTKPNDSKQDHKAWAKRLKAGHENGMKLNLVQVNAYRTALDIKAAA
jgi:hypothetical protein